MAKVFRRIKIGKILAFSFLERVFSKSNNNHDSIPGRNIHSLIIRNLKPYVSLPSCLSAFNSKKTDVIEPGLISMREKVTVISASISKAIASTMSWAHSRVTDL